MNLLVRGQRKIALLFAACFVFIFILSIAFSSAVIYRLAHLQWQARALYKHSLAISHEAQGMLVDASSMHTLMLRTAISPDAVGLPRVDAALQVLESRMRQDLAAVTGESDAYSAARNEISRQLDDWHATHVQMLNLLRAKRRDQALALGRNRGFPTYSGLESSVYTLARETREHSLALAEEAGAHADEAIREAWWMLGALAFLNALCAVGVIRRISLVMKEEARLVARLHDSEQRLKMALSGGNQGTWDLDVTSGKLTFDAQWGNLLGYVDNRTCPATMDQWTDLIFGEDRERVLKAIHDHIEGRTPEYRAEYRMRGSGGELRWVAGHGKATHRDSAGRATRIVGITQEITERKHSEQRVWNLAHTDILTGLPNRVLLYERLTQTIAYARRHGSMFALFFLDLDGFKKINDDYGHDIGDKLLKEAAERLGSIIRGEDTMARVGGDEFIFILNGIEQREDATIAADKILALLKEEFLIENCRCTIGGSIGITIFPDDSEQMDALVSHADDAMYVAKAKGKNNYQFFEPAI